MRTWLWYGGSDNRVGRDGGGCCIQRHRRIGTRLAVLLVLAPLCNYGIWQKYVHTNVEKWRKRIKIGSNSSSNSSCTSTFGVSIPETTIPATAHKFALHITIPVVVQLSGELGNHLSKIASAVAIAVELERYNTNENKLVGGMVQRLVLDEMKRARTNSTFMPNVTIAVHITANLLLRHQDGTTKWLDSVAALEQCFPTLVNAFDSHASAAFMNDTSTLASSTRSSSASATMTTTTPKRPWRWNRRRRHGNNVLMRQSGAGRLDIFQASHYDVRALEQKWYNVGLNSDNATVVDDTLWRVVQEAIRASIRHVVDSLHTTSNTSSSSNSSTSSSSSNNSDNNGAILIDESIHNITLYSNHLMHLDYRLDRYYPIFHDFFAVSPTCCTVNDDSSIRHRVPDNDEVVFYMRGFTTEMPRRGVRLGFEELEPHALVKVLREYYPHNAKKTTTTIDAKKMSTLNHALAPKKIALLSRYAHRDDVMRPYVTALDDDGWSVRVMASQSMMQDFCFLQASSYHSIGVARSTFFYWAALLGGPKMLDDEANDRQSSLYNRRVVTLYSMNTTARRAWAESNNRGPQGGVLESYNFTHASVLQRQWEFRTFTND